MQPVKENDIPYGMDMLELDWAIGAKTSDYISHNSPRVWANLLARLVNSLLFRCKRERERIHSCPVITPSSIAGFQPIGLGL